MFALRTKIAWRAKFSGSLWTKFMQARYGEFASDESAIKDNVGWKKLQLAWLQVKNRITWTKGKGELNFWHDNWTNISPLSNIAGVRVMDSTHRVRDVL